MARLRLYPHRTAEPDSVSWLGWWLERDGKRSPLPPILEGWDYAKDETVGISVVLDEVRLLESTGLTSLNDLEILVMADCSQAQDRFTAHRPLVDCAEGKALDVPLEIPRGRAAGSLRLSAHVVLARTTPARGERIAHLRGSRIHSAEPSTVRLEGDASRFPTDPVPFSELGLGNGPWTVLAVFEDLSDSFMGGVRLLVNTEHPAGQASLDPATGHRMGSLLRADIIRLLVAQTAPLVERDNDPHPEEGSVGQVLEGMCQQFLGRSLKAASQMYREDPSSFDLLLHDRLDPLIGVIE